MSIARKNFDKNMNLLTKKYSPNPKASTDIFCRADAFVKWQAGGH